jgi:phospholipid/cholesterol/gamma-HCH transport system substrate-binding protein
VQGVARFSESLNKRDEQLRALLANANKVSGVLGQRSDQIMGLVRDTNALLVALRNESSALDSISYNISAVTQQLKGFITENKGQFKQTFDQLNGVLTILDNRKNRIQLALNLLNKYALSFGEAVSSGPFFKAYLQNLLPGQFVQPFVDAAFSDLGLDPNVLLPSKMGDPQTGQKATPALPIPYPRTGQGGEPRLTIPDAITGNPGDPGCGPPGIPLPGPTGCYPYREPIPPGPPGGPPPGPPLPPAQDYSTVPTPQPAAIPAPGQVGDQTGVAPQGPLPGPSEGGQ